jgi:hypothetical protein
MDGKSGAFGRHEYLPPKAHGKGFSGFGKLIQAGCIDRDVRSIAQGEY